MRTTARVAATPQLAVGIVILVLGILLTLDRLNLVDASSGLRFWPVALVAVGGVMLARRRDTAGRFWGWMWIVVGAWLLLNTLGLVQVRFWELIWPAVLILLGLRLITHTLRQGGTGAERGAGTAHLIAVIGESKRANNDNPFRGAHLTAFMGGCQLDLRQAIIPPGEEAVLEVFAMMGGVEIVAPSTWTVVSNVMPIMGGVEDKRLLPVATPGAATDLPSRLLLQGTVIMGGLTIKS